LTHTFARAGAVVALKVEDYYLQKERSWLRVREKNGELISDGPKSRADVLRMIRRRAFRCRP
jgi:hypothetical protein